MVSEVSACGLFAHLSDRRARLQSLEGPASGAAVFGDDSVA